MTYAEGMQLARQRKLGREFAMAYRFFKPWWKFWLSESEAVELPLADWDL